ncbi:MAG: Gfo/Idh/MocA family oxidoreductase [Acidimicrobiales bacterium]
MTTQPEVRVGIVGTSWWSDAMYFPALVSHPIGRFTAVCGRDKERTRAAATRWNVPHAFTDWKAMLDSDEIDAVIVASTNETHFPITMAALERRLPVLCEKPIGLNAAEADEMATAARAAQVTTMVPFTYRWMPSNQYVKRLLDEGYVGRPYHLNMRYYAGYARAGGYAWRFDNEKAGAGILGDLGAHWLDMARWFLGEITAVSATTGRFVTRGPRPDGTDYPRGEDSAVLMARFESGALAILQTSAVCWEGTAFGQTHLLDLHGSEGTLYATNDWDHVQEVRGVKAGEKGPAHALDIPDALWAGAPRAPVHDTYRHIFRRTEAMTRGWVTAIAEGRFVEPDLTTGARVQQLIGAGLASVAGGGQWQQVPAP